MKKIFLSKLCKAIALLAFGMATSCVYATVNDWTGPYIGAAAGANDFNAHWRTSSINIPGLSSPTDSSSPHNFTNTQAGVDGYVGYNYQFSRSWVVGLEADIAYPQGVKNMVGIPGCAIGCVAGFPGPGNDSSQVKLGWSESARLRIGYLVHSTWMFYGVAGLTRQEVSSSLTCQHSNADPLCYVKTGSPYETITNNKTKFGWTMGVGLEKQLGGNFLIRGEYDYSDFGSWDNTAGFVSQFPAVVNYNLKLYTQALSIGLTYKF